MSDYENKILVALDGSGRSAKTIQYLCTFKPFRDRELVLFNVMNKVPESYYDLRSDFSQGATSRAHAWEAGCRAKMKKFMDDSRNQLIAWGFTADQVHILICPRTKGIARDILHEAQKGYHALVLRRRGWAGIVLPLVMGSVSAKLMETAVDVPVILAGVQEVTHSLFLAVDGSPGSMRAVKFAAGMVRRSGCRIVLGTVIRDFSGEGDTSGIFDIDGLGDAVTQTRNEARKILMKAGLSQDQITIKTMTGAESRSGIIVETAMAEGCDGVVFGRKGKSEVGDFNIGRVPWKVVHGARRLTVWVVP